MTDTRTAPQVMADALATLTQRVMDLEVENRNLRKESKFWFGEFFKLVDEVVQAKRDLRHVKKGHKRKGRKKHDKERQNPR